jgi:hypothetical protein
MNKQLVRLLISLITLSIITTSMVAPAQAQELDLTNVTFEQLGQSEIDLIGPYDSTYFLFAIPADWIIINEPELNLSLGVSFNEAIENQPDNADVSSGTLSVRFNGDVLTVIPLFEIGEHEIKIPIPLDAFTSNRDDGRMELRFSLDNRVSCYGDNIRAHMSVFIHPNSYITLPHDFVLPNTSLEIFPRPIFQNSFVEDSAVLVIPDQPTAAELQAAITVASGMGSITSNRLLLDMTTLSKITPEHAASNHLIYVGNASSLTTLEIFDLPQPYINNRFEIFEGDPDDGVIQMINSPWSTAHVILVVSGNTDQGTIKAAQALSTGFFLTSLSPNLAIIRQVQPDPIVIARPENQTLADLGYPNRLFSQRGINSFRFEFYVPPGYTAAFDAYFELFFAHSALLEFDRSGISIFVNQSAIGSTRLTETTAAQATNGVQFPIPASIVVPGRNTIDVIANLIPIDFCTPPGYQGLWVNLWNESILHLPLTVSPIRAVSSLNLADYPAPFISDPTLGSTAFVLSRNDLESWRSAAQMASFMGLRARGTLTTLSVFYGDETPSTEMEKYNFIIIGSPSQNPIINEINSDLPVPFLESSDIVPLEDNFQVTYLIPSDSPLGYVETMPSPWNPDYAILAILGNQPQGLLWATTAFIDPDLRSDLAGNFAVVNNRQILTAETRSSSSAIIDTIGVTQVGGESQIEDTTPPKSEQPEWILPVIIGLVSVIVLIIIVALIRRWITSASRR